jgi:hypothetical protein
LTFSPDASIIEGVDGTLLVARLHVDLRRQATAMCPSRARRLLTGPSPARRAAIG